MPASFVIDHARREVRSRAWGVLVDADLEATQRALRAEAGFDPLYRQLYDFTAVTEVRVTGTGLRELARRSPFSPRARRAIVVPSDVAFGMARMYGLVGDRDEALFQIFRDLPTAERWLASDDGPPAP